MKKTLTSIAAIAVSIAAMITPMTTNAVFTAIDGNPDDFAQLTEGFTEVKDFHLFDSQDYDYLYVNETGTEFKGFKKITVPDLFVEPADGVEKDTVAKALRDEIRKNYEKANVYLRLNDKYSSDTTKIYRIEILGVDKVTTVADAAGYVQFLKENDLIKSGKMITERYSLDTWQGMGINCYEPNYYKYDDNNNLIRDENNIPKLFTDKKDILTEYVSKELKGYSIETIETSDDMTYIRVTPPEGASLFEQLNVADKIYSETKFAPSYESPASNVKIDSNAIDVLNAVKGDANCDGKTTIADAVAILQSIGNKDKYALSAQGEFNGDIIGNYDGVTANDALEIQKMDAEQNK